MKNTSQQGHRRSSALKQRGQGLTEYIIIVALIAIGAIVAVSMFGSSVQAQFNNMAAALTGGENADFDQQATDSAAATRKDTDLGNYADK